MRNPANEIAPFVVCCLMGAYSVSIGNDTLRAQAEKHHSSYPNGGELVQRGAPYMLTWEGVRIGDGCVDILGAFGAGRFFFDLKRKYTVHGPIFRVGHRVVTDFPDEVTLVVSLASGVPCSREDPPGPAIPPLDTLKSLRAEAEYIRDLKKYPLEINLTEEGNDLPVRLPSVPTDRLWYYRFEVKTKGVRLTDALVISLFSKEGKKVGQLTWSQ